MRKHEGSLQERVRCSSLVDWPVYPRLAYTTRASNHAQCLARRNGSQYAYAGQGGYPVCRTSTVRGETPDGHDGWSGNEGRNFPTRAGWPSSYRPVAFSTVAMATICRSSVILALAASGLLPPVRRPRRRA
jgi:hypothetical protein